MRRAIIIRFLAIVLLTALLSGGISAVTEAIREENQARDQLTQLVTIAAHDYEMTPAADGLSKILGGERVTIIAPDGQVIDDSQLNPEAMENHGDREEVMNVKADAVTTVSRQSVTTGDPFMYGATLLKDGNILRLAKRYDGIAGGIREQLPIALFTFVIAAFIAGIVASVLARRIVSPLESFTDQITAGNYEKLPADSSYYELEAITRRIQELLKRLEQSQQDIKMQHERMNMVLDNMVEGFVLIDGKQQITLFNNAARKIFKVPNPTGETIESLGSYPQLVEAVDNAAIQKTATVFDLSTETSIYSVHVSPVSGQNADDAEVTILFIDVGVERTSQQQRSEFFSNASHELKTPMTTVLGLSEMLDSGLIADAETRQVYGRIHTEVKRMNALIADILTISRVESGVVEQPWLPVDLAEIAQSVIQALTPRADGNNIRIITHLETCILTASQRRMQELFDNLIDNAIKYNVHGGEIEVSVQRDKAAALIRIRDTGVGIPAEAQGRVFERFYRVDAGRSKAVGGTGLGLAIVKHIVLGQGGSIDLSSTPGGGTVITVKLPMAPAT